MPITGKIKKGTTTAWVLIANIAKKSKGPIKKEAEIIQQFTTDFDLDFSRMHGIVNTFKIKMENFIKDNGGKQYIKDSSWMVDEFMQDIIKQKDNLNLSPGLQKLYTNAYNSNIEAYNNTNIEGTWEYEAKLMFESFMQQRWVEGDTRHKQAHESLKGTKAYEDIRNKFKALRVDNYFPHIPKSLDFMKLFKTDKFEKALAKQVDKDIEKAKHNYLINNDSRFKKYRNVAVKSRTEKEYKDAFNDLESDYARGTKKYSTIKSKTESRLKDFFFHGEGSLNSSNFMNRGQMFNMFDNVVKRKQNGKIKYTPTQIYETNLSNVIDRYNDSSSKILSTMKYAPEYLNSSLVSKDVDGKVQGALRKIRDYENKFYPDNMTANYLQTIIENEMLGINTTAPTSFIKFSKYFGNFFSSGGLSALFFPGAKNFVLGQAMSLSAHSARFYTKALYNLCNKNSREMMRQTAQELGAIGYTRKEFEGIQRANTISTKLYEISGQNAAENVNRMVDIEATKLQFTFLAQEIADGNLTDRQLKKIENWFKDVARFTDKDFDILLKSGKALQETDEGLIAYNHLMNKAMHYVQRATQGGLSVLDNPRWMSDKRFKYLLSFMRIARSATTLTHKLHLKSLMPKNGADPRSFLKFALGAFAGMELYELAKEVIFSKEDETKYSPLYKRVARKAMQAEIFQAWGFLVDAIPTLNPYYREEQNYIYNMLEIAPPAVGAGGELVGTVFELGKSILELAQGDVATGFKRMGRTLNNFAKSRVSLYNQTVDAVNRGVYPFIRDKSKAKNYDRIRDAQVIVNQYKKLLGPQKGDSGRKISDSKLYTEPVINSLYFDNDKDLTDNLAAAFNFEMYELINNPTQQRRQDAGSKIVQRAYNNILSSVRKINPLDFSDENNKSFRSNLKAYEAWEEENVSAEDTIKIRKAYNYYKVNIENRLNRIIQSKSFKEKRDSYENIHPKIKN